MELSDKLIPTLDTNDKTTLKQSLASTNKKLAAVISTAQGKQEELECKASEWKVFQVSRTFSRSPASASGGGDAWWLTRSLVIDQ